MPSIRAVFELSEQAAGAFDDLVARARYLVTHSPDEVDAVGKWLDQEFTLERSLADWQRTRRREIAKRRSRMMPPSGSISHQPELPELPGDDLRVDRLELAARTLESQPLSRDGKNWESKAQFEKRRREHAWRSIVVSLLILDEDASSYLNGVTDLAAAPWIGSSEVMPNIRGRLELARMSELSPSCRAPIAGTSLPPGLESHRWIRILAQSLMVLQGPVTDKRPEEGQQPDDLRPAKWFSQATDEALYPDLLRTAVHGKRLTGSVKNGGRWVHSIDSVSKLYPEHRSALMKAKESEGNVSKRKG